MEAINDDTLAEFTSITGATPERATQYLRVTESNLEQAIQLYFEQDGADMGASVPAQPARAAGTNSGDPINLDDDDEDEPTAPRAPPGVAPVEDDEAMARRLQEEMYGGGGARGGGALSEDDVRAPQARRAETLLGPGSADFLEDEDALNSAVASQLNRRQRRAMGSKF